LTGKEIQAVLCELGLPEIIALSKRYQSIDTFGLREQEQLLCMSLQSYISSLPQMQQKLIEEMSKAMYEE